MAISYLTEEGLQKIRAELDHLTTIERPSISRQIAEARDKGDLSENAEYDAAKEAQGMLEARIAKLETTLANSRIIDESRIDTSKVQILNKVRIKNLKTNAELEYILVAEQEANLKEGKLSVSTPIARGLIGKKKGDIVEINVPSGKMSFEIISISRSMASISSKIIQGEIPCYKVAEDEHFFAFLDINPVQKGHTLVVPKQETDYLFDSVFGDLGNMMVFAQKVAKAMKKVLPCNRIGVAVLGLDVPHAHIHLIPINKGSDIEFSKPKLQFTKEEFQQIAKEIALAF